MLHVLALRSQRVNHLLARDNPHQSQLRYRGLGALAIQYRAHAMDDEGPIVGRFEFEAYNDEGAIAQARKYVQWGTISRYGSTSGLSARSGTNSGTIPKSSRSRLGAMGWSKCSQIIQRAIPLACNFLSSPS